MGLFTRVMYLCYIYYMCLFCIRCKAGCEGYTLGKIFLVCKEAGDHFAVNWKY